MELLLLIQFLVTFFIAGGLFFKDNSLKSKSLAIYFVVFSIEILYFLFINSKAAGLYPELFGRYYFSSGLLYGPILWVHFKSITHRKSKLVFKDFLHLIPLIALNVYMFDLMVMPSVDRIAYFTDEVTFYERLLNLNYVRAIHQVGYAVLLYLLYIKNKNLISAKEKFYLSGISLIYLFTTIFTTLLVFFANSWKDFSWYYIISNVLLVLVVSILYNDPKFFRTFREKYESSSLTNDDMLSIKQKLENLFIEEKLYLQNDLSVEILSKKFNIKSHHISQTFTGVFKENFNDYVNKLRIEHSKVLLIDPQFNKYKIEAIAKESGFNNKVTFYKAFSKFTELTPAQFRKLNKIK